MLNVRCPSCSHNYRIPPSFMGKKIRCKQESCKQAFLITEEVIAPTIEEIPEVPPMASQPSSAPAPSLELEPAFLETQSDELDVIESSNSFPRNEDNRYPNLNKYLTWLKVIAKIQLYLFLSGAVLILIFAVFASIVYVISGRELLISIVEAALLALCGYIIYVFSLAGIEFTYVIIDIESNTRYVRHQIEDSHE